MVTNQKHRRPMKTVPIFYADEIYSNWRFHVHTYLLPYFQRTENFQETLLLFS